MPGVKGTVLGLIGTGGVNIGPEITNLVGGAQNPDSPVSRDGLQGFGDQATAAEGGAAVG